MRSCDKELCSRLEVHRGLLGRQVLFIPYNAVAGVAGPVVRLGADAAPVAEQDGWHRRPGWISREGRRTAAAGDRRRRGVPASDAPPARPSVAIH